MITDEHTDQTLKIPESDDFWIQGTSKCVNIPKTRIQKFDPKTILSLYHMGKRKKKKGKKRKKRNY